jgi:hypothetical protein
VSYTGDQWVTRLTRYFSGSCKAVLAGLKITVLTAGAQGIRQGIRGQGGENWSDWA